MKTNSYMSLAELDRRRFIRLCAAGSVGLTLGRPRRAAAMGPLLLILAEFSLAVASAVVAALITDYLRSLRDQAGYRDHIQRTNERLARQGFRDTSHSTVYCSRNSDPRIYYPVVNSRCSCLNFTAPFFRDAWEGAPVTMIQGPQMAGLNYAAKMLRDSRPATEVADYLVPVTGSRISYGSPQDGYDGPLVYDSREARVNVTYNPTSPNAGIVTVKARRYVDHSPIVNDEWGIAFS
jgi:hypothetical protein